MFNGGGAGQGIESFVGQLEFPVTDHGEQLLHFRSLHPGVDAFGTTGLEKRCAELLEAQVRGVVGFENGIEIALDDASDAATSTEPFSFGPALSAGHQRSDYAGAVAADVLTLRAPTWE